MQRQHEFGMALRRQAMPACAVMLDAAAGPEARVAALYMGGRTGRRRWNVSAREYVMSVKGCVCEKVGHIFLFSCLKYLCVPLLPITLPFPLLTTNS